MNTHLVAIAVLMFAAGDLAACTPEPHEPNTETGVSPNMVVPTKVIANWTSDSTHSVEVFVTEESGFGLSGRGCGASGSWAESDGQIRVGIPFVS